MTGALMEFSSSDLFANQYHIILNDSYFGSIDFILSFFQRLSQAANFAFEVFFFQFTIGMAL